MFHVFHVFRVSCVSYFRVSVSSFFRLLGYPSVLSVSVGFWGFGISPWGFVGNILGFWGFDIHPWVFVVKFFF